MDSYLQSSTLCFAAFGIFKLKAYFWQSHQVRLNEEIEADLARSSHS